MVVNAMVTVVVAAMALLASPMSDYQRKRNEIWRNLLMNQRDYFTGLFFIVEVKKTPQTPSPTPSAPTLSTLSTPPATAPNSTNTNYFTTITSNNSEGARNLLWEHRGIWIRCSTSTTISCRRRRWTRSSWTWSTLRTTQSSSWKNSKTPQRTGLQAQKWAPSSRKWYG